MAGKLAGWQACQPVSKQASTAGTAGTAITPDVVQGSYGQQIASAAVAVAVAVDIVLAVLKLPNVCVQDPPEEMIGSI